LATFDIIPLCDLTIFSFDVSCLNHERASGDTERSRETFYCQLLRFCLDLSEPPANSNRQLSSNTFLPSSTMESLHGLDGCLPDLRLPLSSPLLLLPPLVVSFGSLGFLFFVTLLWHALRLMTRFFFFWVFFPSIRLLVHYEMKEDGLFFFSASSSSWTSSYFVGAAPCNGALGFLLLNPRGSRHILARKASPATWTSSISQETIRFSGTRESFRVVDCFGLSECDTLRYILFFSLAGRVGRMGK
jgi:hypothetical protein